MTAADLAQIDGVDEGMVKWLFGKLGIDRKLTIICDSNRPEKIRGLRAAGFDRAGSAIKGPGSIKDGIDLLCSMKVYYTSCSKNVKHEQENYSRKVDKYGVVLEEPEDVDNHTIDPARYVAQWLKKEGIIRKM